MRGHRLLISGLILLLLVGFATLFWTVLDWPPPKLILTYGFPPTGGPTGRTRVIEGIEFIELEPGYVRMGSHFLCRPANLLGQIGHILRLPIGTRAEHSNWECPPEWVEISNRFWLSRTEVTNAQYGLFHSPDHRWSDAATATLPVTNVAWTDAVQFCSWLAQRATPSFRLPLESEWEYACRAGNSGSSTPIPDSLRRTCWYSGNSMGRSHPVGRLQPNPWGFYDMLGNVREWCASQAIPDPLDRQDLLDPRPLRGGSWKERSYNCRPSAPLMQGSGTRSKTIGFRVVMCVDE